MRKLLFTLPAIFLILILLTLVYLGTVSNYGSVLEANWEISLPRDATRTELYKKDSGVSFHGDGIRYHVFSWEPEAPVTDILTWQPHNSDQGTRHHDTVGEAATAWLDEIGVPEVQRPKLTACTVWYRSKADNSELLILWDGENKLLYLLENLL